MYIFCQIGADTTMLKLNIDGNLTTWYSGNKASNGAKL